MLLSLEPFIYLFPFPRFSPCQNSQPVVFSFKASSSGWATSCVTSVALGSAACSTPLFSRAYWFLRFVFVLQFYSFNRTALQLLTHNVSALVQALPFPQNYSLPPESDCIDQLGGHASGIHYNNGGVADSSRRSSDLISPPTLVRPFTHRTSTHDSV